MKTLNKGVLLALGAGALASLLFRPPFDAAPVQAQTPRQANETGRYTLVVTPPVMETGSTTGSTIYATPYVMDTRTGRVWVHQPAPDRAGSRWRDLGSPVGRPR